MARIASRKSSGKKMMKRSMKRSVSKRSVSKRSRKACVSAAAKRMHKKAKTSRGHQLALARAQKACKA